MGPHPYLISFCRGASPRCSTLPGVLFVVTPPTPGQPGTTWLVRTSEAGIDHYMYVVHELFIRSLDGQRHGLWAHNLRST